MQLKALLLAVILLLTTLLAGSDALADASLEAQAAAVGAMYDCPYAANTSFMAGNIGYSFTTDEQDYALAQLLEEKHCVFADRSVVFYVSSINFPSNGTAGGADPAAEQGWLDYWNYTLQRWTGLGYKVVIFPLPFIINDHPFNDVPPGLRLLTKSDLNLAPADIPAVYECRDGRKTVVASIYDSRTLAMGEQFYDGVLRFFNTSAVEKIAITPPSDFGEYGFPFGIQTAWWNGTDDVSDCYLTGDADARALIPGDPPAYAEYNGVLNQFRQDLTTYVRGKTNKPLILYLGYGDDSLPRDGFSYTEAVTFAVSNGMEIHSTHGYGVDVMEVPLAKIVQDKPAWYSFDLEDVGNINEFLAIKNLYHAAKYNVTTMTLYANFLYDHLDIVHLLPALGPPAAGSLYQGKNVTFSDGQGLGSLRSSHLYDSYLDSPVNGSTIPSNASYMIGGWGYFDTYGDQQHYQVLVYAGPLEEGSQFPGDQSCDNCTHGLHPEYMRLVANTTTTSERILNNGDTSRFGALWQPNLAAGKAVVRVYLFNNQSGVLAELPMSPLFVNISGSVSGAFILNRLEYDFNDPATICSRRYEVQGTAQDSRTPGQAIPIVVLDEYRGTVITSASTAADGAFDLSFDIPSAEATQYPVIRVYAYVDDDGDGVPELVGLRRNLSYSPLANIGWYNTLGNQFFTVADCDWRGGAATDGDAQLGDIYVDASGALCFYDGISWSKAAGSGTCS